ncbi:MAG: transposase [Planctomycetota bacterium]
MPSPKRIVIAGMPHHIVQRGNNKSTLFPTTGDYDTYLALLCKFLQESGCHLLAYALMTNHVHLLLRPPDKDALSKLMLKLNVTYVKYFQEKHRVTGHIFESRFKSYPVEDDEYLWQVVRYIDQNPLRAGLVDKPHEYRFSSAAAHISGTTDGIITQLPFDPGDSGAFAEYVAQPGSKDELTRIQESIRRNKPLGGKRFVSRLADIFGIKFARPGRPRKP